MVSTLARLRRVAYLPYYIARTDYGRLARCMAWVETTRHKGKLLQAAELVWCSVRYGSSFIDYYDLHMYALDRRQRSGVAGTGVAHDFHDALNAPQARGIFRSKAEFMRHFGPLMGRESLALGEADPAAFAEFIQRHPVFAAKPSRGTQGTGFRFVDSNNRDAAELQSALLAEKLDIVEEPIVQHEVLQRIYPRSVNTLRAITVYTDGRVDIVATVLKLGTSRAVDNLSLGGIAAPVNTETGVVNGPALTKDPWAEPYYQHPVTGAQISGVPLPHWDQVLELCDRAARVVPTVRTVGWDIAITPEDPILVEGNDNWGKTLWLLPTGTGGLDVLRRYADV